MAYVDDTLLEDEQNTEGGPALAASSVGQAQTKSNQQSPSEIAKRGSGNFQNLGEYLRVNAPQQFGEKVAGKIGDEVTSAGQTIDQAQSDFKGRVDDNTVRDTNNLSGMVATDPRQVNQEQFTKLRDANYGGPSSIYDAKDLTSRVSSAAGTATGKANASQSEAGRFALLDSYFGKPKYTQGQKTLDNLLIQNDPGSQAAFEQMRQNADAVSARSKQLAPEAEAYAAQGRAATEGTRTAARGALGIDNAGAYTGQGAIGALNQGVDQRTQGLNDANAAAFQQAKGLTPGNKFNLSPEFLAAMGISGVDKGYGVDANPYLSQYAPITREQALTGDEAARARALESLSGGGPLFNSYDEAGTAPQNPKVNVNKTGYQNAVQGRKQDYTNQTNQYNQQRDQIQQQIDKIKNNVFIDPAEVQNLIAPYLRQQDEIDHQRSILDMNYLGSQPNAATFIHARS